MRGKTILPAGLTERPGTLADIETVYDLSRTYELAYYGQVDRSLDELKTLWTASDVNLAEDTLLIFDQSEQLIGSLFVDHHKHAKFYATLRILPEYSDARLGDYLLELAEALALERMAQAEPGVRVTLNAWLPGNDLAGAHCLLRLGMQEIRRFWRMEIELSSEPAAPEWPAGVALRPYVPGRDEQATFEMVDTAFSDHWGHIPHRFEEWKHWTVERPRFDPTFWFIAYEGERIAGGSLCVDEGEYGWVDDLAVLRPWRRKGLGMALLLHSFGEFYRRGKRKAGLGVDSQNLTGALRLYQRAGMHMAHENVSYEKELRVGVELSTRELTV